LKARARPALTAHEQQPLATITPDGAMRITSVPNVAGTATQGLPPS
jgi:hypothetical protein